MNEYTKNITLYYYSRSHCQINSKDIELSYNNESDVGDQDTSRRIKEYKPYIWRQRRAFRLQSYIYDPSSVI